MTAFGEALSTGVPVQRGTVICERTENEPLPRAGAGTAEAAQGRRLVATVDGLAVVSAGVATVARAEVHPGDVGVSQTLIGKGNLVVTGSVLRGAKVRAAGGLVVLGEVIMAQVEAMGAVVLRRGCLGGFVVAGINHYSYRMSIERLEIVQASLERLLFILGELGQHPSFRTMDLTSNLKPLLEVLTTRSFADFTVQVAEAVKRCEVHAYLGDPLDELLMILHNRFTGFSFLSVTRQEIEQVRALCAVALAQLVEASGADRSILITGGVAEDSTMKAADSIVASGAILKRCRVTADGAVNITGEVLGGTVQAGLSIAASSVSGPVVLEAGGGQSVSLGNSSGDIVVRIGQQSTRMRGVAQPAVIRQKGDALEIRAAREVD